MMMALDWRDGFLKLLELRLMRLKVWLPNHQASLNPQLSETLNLLGRGYRLPHLNNLPLLDLAEAWSPTNPLVRSLVRSLATNQWEQASHPDPQAKFKPTSPDLQATNL